jgi:two-component system, NarL family, sensor histidine kinase UhpB
LGRTCGEGYLAGTEHGVSRWRCSVRKSSGQAGFVAPLTPPPVPQSLPDDPAETDLPLRQFVAVIDLLPTAIWIADGEQIRHANTAALRLMNVSSKEDLVGRAVHSMLHPTAHAELRRQAAAALANPGEPGSLHATLCRPDGQRCEVEIALTALPDHGRTTVQMVVHDVTRRQRELQELRQSRQALRRLSANIVEGREAERRRIARELHDELGQGLSALKLELSAWADDTLLERDGERVRSMLRRLDEIMAAVRRIAIDLRPQMLDDLGLGPAVEWLVQDFARRAGLRCTTQIDDVGNLDDSVATALYRMVQEALTNVVRHSQATEVTVELRLRDGRAHLTVCDNGVGMQEGRAPRDSQFGLLGMQERADMLGGQLQLGTAAGGGTCVSMELPLGASSGTAGP